jgi:hypothetical protein
VQSRYTLSLLSYEGFEAGAFWISVSENAVYVRHGAIELPIRFKATFEHPAVTLTIECDGGAPICTGIAAEQGLSRDLLRALPIQRLVREATAAAARVEVADLPSSVPARLPEGYTVSVPAVTQGKDALVEVMRQIEQRSPRPRGSRLSDEELDEIASLYRNALAVGRPPTATVAKVRSVTRSTASRWIYEARRRGFLGAALPRKAGEV